ncbi:glycoside hydrolase family 3 N-terminal domain-containing protein [Bacteroidota bacterium]
MKNNFNFYMLLILILYCSWQTNLAQEIYKDPDQPIEKRIQDLISKMTLREKIGQMHQNNLWELDDELLDKVRNANFGSFLNAGNFEDKLELQQAAVKESRLGIPLIFGRDVIHGYKTIFPIPLGQSASWNPDLIEEATKIAATEAAENGIHWTFAPMVDISRDPRWGRIAESCGEDPYLAAQISSAMVRGFQGENLADENTIAACAKHYVGYGAAEAGKDYNTTWIPERYLRDVYLKPFKGCVDAGVATLMSAFNDLNGVPASGNEFTLRQILRDEWHFNGFVISDWNSVTEMINHGYCADTTEAALKAIKAGVNMEMVSPSYSKKLKSLVNSGKVSEKMINEMVEGILRIKFKLGLFDNPYREINNNPKTLSKEHLAVAKKSAEQCIVLLKNEDDLLPFSEEIKTLAVIGPLADKPRAQLGTWIPDGDPKDTRTPLFSLKELYGDKVNILYSPGMEDSRTYSTDGFEEAVEIAEKSDAVIIFVGEDDLMSGEAKSRAFLSFPGVQEDLIKAVSETSKPIALVIMAGRPLTFNNITYDVMSILYAWHPGTMGGPAIADILFGKVNPSGKLPVTFPRTVGQVPIYYAHRNTGRPPDQRMQDIKMGVPVKPIAYVSYYLDVDYTPAYPFGFGLSYTEFEYTDLRISAKEISMGESIEISAIVKNIGDVAGEEVVQLYIRDLFGSVSRPVKELKGFQRIYLNPEEEKEVIFNLHTDDLTFCNKNMNVTAEPGDFHLWIGGDSQSGLKTEFKIK